MKNMKKVLIAISVLLMLTTLTTTMGAVKYNTYVDRDVGFYRVQTSPPVELSSR